MDVKEINSALEDVKKLEGVEFKWKESGEKSYGLIAQEVEKVYPELVGTREVFNETTNETKIYKTVQYANLVAPLIESIKELDNHDLELKNKINEQEKKINEQDKKIGELERELDELRELVLNGQENLLN
jgi:peptidoglycan hydrolase CwlO-like protein